MHRDRIVSASVSRGPVQRIGRGGVRLAWALGLALVALGPATSRADLIMAIDHMTGPTAGGVGSFEVSLTNSGSSSLKVADFSFKLQVDPGIHFTGVSTATAGNPYIFDGTGGASGDPNFKFSLDTFPNTGFTASDSQWGSPGYTTMAAGATFGLGLVTYSVDPGSYGTFQIRFATPGTSVSDNNFNTYTLTTQGGRITVVPEPSTLVLASIGLATIALTGIRRRRAATGR